MWERKKSEKAMKYADDPLPNNVSCSLRIWVLKLNLEDTKPCYTLNYD